MKPQPLDPTVQASSVMAALAYVDQAESLEKHLANRMLPMLGEVELLWGPHEKESNLVYVAKWSGGEVPRYVVAIRGTIADIRSLFENLELSLVALPWKTRRYPSVRIAHGIAEAVKHLEDLGGGPHGGGLLRLLGSTEDDAEIIVTGHSQGGCVASVVALWLQEELSGSGRRVVPLTFAAPTAGPASFADAVNGAFDDGCRYYNALDVVPRTWDEHLMATIVDLYPGNGPKCDLLWREILKEAAHHAEGKGYRQPSRAHALPGQVYDERGLFAFPDEMAAQHESLLYVWLTGVPLPAIHTIDPGWHPPPHP